jgi:hypothetical protein
MEEKQDLRLNTYGLYSSRLLELHAVIGNMFERPLLLAFWNNGTII